MKIIFIIINLLSLFSALAQSQNDSLINSYNQTAFDSDTCCWRILSNQKLHLQAGNLIVNYLKNNSTKKNFHSLRWHAGQMFAMAGEIHLAKKYFKKTYSFLYKLYSDEDAKMWYYYAKGTVAFIDRKKITLKKMIDKWPSKYHSDKNYISLKNLLTHWDESYEKASGY